MITTYKLVQNQKSVPFSSHSHIFSCISNISAEKFLMELTMIRKLSANSAFYVNKSHSTDWRIEQNESN